MKLFGSSRVNTTQRMVLGGIFAALIALFTFFPHIGIAGGGYIHLGDTVIFTASYLLGGIWSVFAAAIGSLLADLIAGYPIYMVATFIIKGLTALASCLLLKIFKERLRVISFLIAGLVVPIGYFIAECFFLGYGAGAWAYVPFNLLQAAVGAVSAYVLTFFLEKQKMTY